MTNAELLAKIKAEIERLKGICTAQIKANPGQTFPFVMEMTGYDKLLSFLSTLESEKTIYPWKNIHTYTEEIHEGDMEKMLLELSVGKGEKRTKTALPDRIVDILESENPINPDEAMKKLDEKIALVKQMGTWDGVDVDSYMDEVRGRVSDDLEEAADNPIRKVADAAGHPGWDWTTQDIADAFIAGAEWDRKQMMKEAIHYVVQDDLDSHGVV